MAHTHEIRIRAHDREKIVRFSGARAAGRFEDLLHSLAAVIEDEPQQITEGELEVGGIEVEHSLDQVIEIIVEEAGLIDPATEAALRAPGRVSSC